MPRIVLVTPIRAPAARCFDLARSIDLHAAGMAHTGERAVAGVTSGLIGPGEHVAWRARHLGRWWTLTSRITRYERPVLFVDEMAEGPFRSFRHEHAFLAEGDVTTMRDVFDFEAPLGVLGRLACALFLTRHMRRLLEARAESIRQAAESEEWRRYLPAEP